MTNLVSAVIIGGGGVIVTILAKNASLWATPLLYGCGASALLSVCILAFLYSGRCGGGKTEDSE